MRIERVSRVACNLDEFQAATTMSTSIPEPVVKDGIDYWNTQPASLDGVLGMKYFTWLTFTE